MKYQKQLENSGWESWKLKDETIDMEKEDNSIIEDMDLENSDNKEDKTAEEKKDRSKKIRGIFFECMTYVLIFVFFVIISPKYIWAKAIVDGESMEATLQNEDILIQEKVKYHFSEPSRYDVVVFKSSVSGEDEFWVKRIIGLPGETIQIIDDDIYIDGEKLGERSKGTGDISYYGVAEEPYKIPEGEYFVMGDNRDGDKSWDSRYEEVGTIKKEQIVGHVIARIYPLKKFGLIK